jgi:Asp-tRNA(Asn)/Glu-tRNA(Gln) amidotransferase A subunit family amidase
MANNLENSIRRAMERIAKYVEAVATLTVETGYVRLGANADVDFAQAKPAARTTIRLDGDCQVIIPMQTGESG